MMYYPGAVDGKKRHAMANQKALDVRLSRPRNPPNANKITSGNLRSSKEVQLISDRLYRNNITCKMGPNDLENRHLDKAIQRITEINDDFYTKIRQREPSTVYGRRKKTMSELEPLIERLAQPKTYKVDEFVVNQRGKIERLNTTSQLWD